MCGIFGWNLNGNASGKRAKLQRWTMANALASLNDSRGGDSYGYYADGVIRRGLGKFSCAYLPMMRPLARAMVAMGHTRYATTGAVTTKNAHPFEIGHIVGAHNGMVFNHDELCEAHRRSYAVDSMHLFGHVADGLDMTDIQAYGAVEFIDTESPGDVWLSRFNGGVLAVRKTSLGVYWSSDDVHLKAALRYAGLNSQAYTVKSGTLMYARDGDLWKAGDFPVSKQAKATSPLTSLTYWQDDYAGGTWSKGSRGGRRKDANLSLTEQSDDEFFADYQSQWDQWEEDRKRHTQ